MKHHHGFTAAAAMVLLTSGGGRAASIDIMAAAPGVMLPSMDSATVLTFDDLPLGSLPSYQFNGGVLSGDGAIENASLVGKYPQPAGDPTKYLTVSYPSAVGAISLAFSSPQNYFGLYWGSMDGYNSITFFNGHQQIASFSGTDAAALTGLVANGDQQSARSNRYINFSLGTAFYDEVVLSTTDFGLEVDNIAFDGPVTAIPEPATLGLVCSSLCALFLTRRRRALSENDGAISATQYDLGMPRTCWPI